MANSKTSTIFFPAQDLNTFGELNRILLQYKTSAKHYLKCNIWLLLNKIMLNITLFLIYQNQSICNDTNQ